MDRITVPWAQTYDDFGSDEYSFAPNESQAALVVDVKIDDLAQFIRETLGYTTRPSAGVLNRRTPARHPFFPWLRCIKISRIQGIRFDEPGNTDLGELRGTNVQMPYYHRYRCTLLFQSLPYRVKEDADTGAEYERYTVKLVNPNASILSSTAGQYKFAEAPALGTTYSQAIGIIVPEADVIYQWHQLPEAAILQSGIPTRIKNFLGKTNFTAFDGFDAETLVLTGAKLTPEIAPISPVFFGLDPLTDVPRTYKVEYYFKWYPNGANKVLNRTYLQYLLVTSNGDPVNGKRLYDPQLFATLFLPL